MRCLYFALFKRLKFFGILYIGAAAWSFPSTLEMLNEDIKEEHGVLRVPIFSCAPSDISNKQGVYSFDAVDNESCNNAKFMIISCCFSFVMTSIALLVYFFTADKKNLSDSSGMAFLLPFLLLQTSFSSWALADEIAGIDEWLKEYNEDAGDDLEAVSYGCSLCLLVTTILAVLTAVFVFLEGLVKSRVSDDGPLKRTPSANRNSVVIDFSNKKSPKASTSSIEKSKKVQPKAPKRPPVRTSMQIDPRASAGFNHFEGSVQIFDETEEDQSENWPDTSESA